ncbi:hypothetical protein TUMSATVNIG1_59930 (plasmid) [Vibrio nigripulchritudo]|uniref:trypsin-like serine protease n=1 Tax=Vibrio nigripulchritudo TaxID=28173 RepID=UPI00190D5F8C|nr:trypsin-like serine protease [Vibrio nigripulchritudo]BCL74007.1 hypothetical protein VNTUMSATTG_59440 [Vibrio nigripulchritudo]BDU35384.1 hypothetical protein TUMSATVNIG1_59930 [Vibrio nigripulchritudo]
MKKKKTIFSVIAVTLCACAPAQAIINGTDVAEADYKDFIVQLSTTEGSCGAALISGEFLLTARHCVINESTGAKAPSVTISQGIKFPSNSSHNRAFSVLLDTANATTLDKMKILDKAIFDGHVVPNYPNVSNLSYFRDVNNSDSYYQKDLVLLKLHRPVNHGDGAPIRAIYDIDTKTSNLTKDTWVKFRGWGNTDTNGTSPTSMQEMQFMLATNYIEPAGQYAQHSVIKRLLASSCVDGTDWNCSYKGSDAVTFYSAAGQVNASGDSGTPVVHDGYIYGNISFGNDVYTNGVVTYDLIINDIAAAINQLSFPFSPGKTIELNSSATTNFEVPVQNLTQNDILGTPTLADSTGLFDVDLSDCNRILKPLEACRIKVSFNKTNQVINETKNASISFNNEVNIPLKMSVKVEQSKKDEGSSSGGAIGVWVFLLLLVTRTGLFQRLKP